MSKFMPFIIAWSVLGLAVLVLALRRKMVASEEDDIVHLSGGDQADKAAQHQVALAKRLEVLDKWGKILTIVLAVFGLALACAYLWMMFTATTTDPFAD